MKLSRKEILSIALFLTLIAIIIMDMGLVIPNMVLIAADLEVGLDVVGYMVGIYTFVVGSSALLFGVLTDLYKRKNLVIVAGIMWSCSALLHLLVMEFWQLFALRMVCALAIGVETPAALSYLADTIPSNARSKAYAFWGLVTTLGGLIAGGIALAFNTIPYEEIDPEIVGIEANLAEIIATWPDMLHTWRFPFLFLGGIAVLFTILNVLLTKESKRGVSELVFKDIAEQDLKYSYKIKFGDLKYIFKRKSNFFLIMNFFDVIATGMLIAYIFPYINLEMGISFEDPGGLLRIVVLLLIIAPMGFIIGQFGIAHLADKQVEGGKIAGRVKTATKCAILNVPFIAFALFMTPDLRTNSFFLGTLQVDFVTSWVLWVVFALMLGVGLAFSFGIGPNWFSSLIDMNYPEHRGTMVAMASFTNSIGRGIGAIIGGIMVSLFDSLTLTLALSILIFGSLSVGLWVPLFFTSEKDFEGLTSVMEARAEEMKARAAKRLQDAFTEEHSPDAGQT